MQPALQVHSGNRLLTSRGLFTWLPGLALAVLSALPARGATLVVLNTNDSGPDSLRALIAAANTGDTITFDPAVTGTVALTSGGLTISNSLTISGPGASVLAIDGGGSGPIFTIAGGITAMISGLTIKNGSSPYPGGGGILNNGALTVNNCTLSGNSAHNSSRGGSGGGGILNYFGGTLTVSNSTLSGNNADIGGGGILNFADTVTVINSTLSGNSAGNSVTLMNPGKTMGGGIYNSGTLTVTNSTLSGNSANTGGGIFNMATLTVINSALSGNSAPAGNNPNPAGVGGGGIFNGGSLTVIDSTLSGNSTPGSNSIVQTFGGGIFNGNGASVVNSTLSGNSAFGGGGIFNMGDVTVVSSTLYGNSATEPPPPYGVGPGGGGILNVQDTVNLKNTLLAQETLGGNCVIASLPGLGTAPSTTITSLGHNLSDDTSCTSFFTAIGDQNHVAAGLDPAGLANNGGPTQTIALLLTSPAVYAIPVSPTNYCTLADGVTPVLTDQRGITRPQGPACDIGAFELVANTSPGSNVTVQPVDPTTGGTPVTLTFSSVTQPGETTVTTSSSGPSPPSGFSLGNPPVYYNLSTTAVYTPPITVCINYSGITFTTGPALFHFEGGVWTDVTTSVDPVNHIVCGAVNSLSPFALFRSAAGIQALSPAAANALLVSGTSVLNISGGIAVNSNSTKAMVVSGVSKVTAKAVQIVGGFSAPSGAISPAPVTGAASLPDPLATLQAPSYSGCNFTNFKLTGVGSAALTPGVYCGGITIAGNATATFAAGTYILNGGGLNVSGNASVSGQGLTFYNTGSGSSYQPVTISGSVKIKLSAPTSGAMNGILFFQDRNVRYGSANTLSGGVQAQLGGALYFPTTGLVVSGNSGSLGGGTVIIANTVEFSGNAYLR